MKRLHISVKLPSVFEQQLIGKTAGELRSLGYEISARVPDGATWTSALGVGWVNAFFEFDDERTNQDGKEKSRQEG